MTLVVDADESKFALGHTRTVVVLVWRNASSIEAIHTLARTFDAIRGRHSDSLVGFLSIIERDCSLDMPSEVRGGLTRVLDQNQDVIGGAAIVYEGEGFKATVVRSVITAINIAARTRFPNGVFGDVSSAADWLVERIGETPQAQSSLVGAAMRLRSSRPPMRRAG
jgi:hypothetical protein